MSLLSANSKSKQREPPPALFLHPSPGASYVSLPGILAPGAGSSLKRENSVNESIRSGRHGVNSAPDAHKGGRGLRSSEGSRSADRTDALWAEMQSTLEEVELSASGGTHVFGPEHDKRLAELRAAQISLAQAWARNEVEGTIEPDIPSKDHAAEAKNSTKVAGVDATVAGSNTEDIDKVRTNSSVGKQPNNEEAATKSAFRLEDQTEADILVARKRREANDLYFDKVNSGVRDVVERLEQVAIAMRAVEKESTDAWGDTAQRAVNP